MKTSREIPDFAIGDSANGRIPLDFAWAAGISKEDSVKLATHVGIEAVDANLVEVVESLLSLLYERFDFTELPLEIVQRELSRLRKRA